MMHRRELGRNLRDLSRSVGYWKRDGRAEWRGAGGGKVGVTPNDRIGINSDQTADGYPPSCELDDCIVHVQRPATELRNIL